MLTIPFFVLAGAIMAEGGMARRLVAFADVLVGFTRVRGGLSRGQRAGHDVSQRHFRLGGRRHIGDRIGDDPANGEERLSARVRDQCDDHRLGAGAAGAAEPQRGDLLARDRRHDLDHQPVHGRRRARPAARPLARSFCVWSSPIATAIRSGETVPLREAVKITIDAAVGPDHARHHPRRHPRRRLHRDRGRRRRLRLGLLRHHVHLSRLPLARPARARAPHACARWRWS